MGYKLPQFVGLKIPNSQSLRKVRRLGIILKMEKDLLI